MTTTISLEGTLFDLFDGLATSQPDASALVSGERHLTYAELALAIDEWATAIQAHGIEPGTVVAVALPRCARAVCAALGVMKARATLLMIDPADPAARQERLVAESGCKLIVSGDNRPLITNVPTLTDAPVARDEHGVERPSSSDAAYVVYTSGSTGTPKGVVCDHGALANVVRAQRELLGVTPADHVALIAPFTVDASIFELTLGLCSGATLHIAEAGQSHPGIPLRRFLREHGITALVATPTTLGSLEPAEHPGLRLVISAGEALDAELARRWAPGRRLVNAYGPTEATIWTSMADVSGTEPEIPLGNPIPGARIAVLRPDLTVTDPDEEGELYISGAGLARGYLNAPNSSFIDGPAGRTYRTGDRAVRRGDGTIIFIGRADDQIKLGGLRIEPGEILYHLRQHPAVADAAVRLAAGRLVAYVAPVQHSSPKPEELIAFLEERLAYQLVPTTYILIDALPRTPWGKLDVVALPSPETALERRDDPVREPNTAEERYLVELARAMLEVEEVSTSDDLFMLGLNSILVARLLARVDEDLGIELAPIDIFEHPTIDLLAQHLAGRGAPADQHQSAQT